jgi:acetolactate synthase-1/2/3 large subunit/N2-(2-carboxyethyl)arginine synthase
MRGAEILLYSLRSQGVDSVFGIVGREGSSIRFNEVPGIRFYLTRHEFTAGIAAEVYARSTGRPQVCFSTMGPGAANLTTAISSACLDRSPLVAISAQVESFDLYYNHTQQCIDQRSVMAPMCKYAAEPKEVRDIPRIIQEAFGEARSELPGPSYISIPTNLFRQEISDDIAQRLLEKHSERLERKPSAPSRRDVGSLYRLMANSKKPIAILGNYVVRADAIDELKAFIEKHHIPCVSSYTGKGILPADHPLNIGTISCYLDGLLSYECLGNIFDQTDLILLIGYDYAEDIRPEMWTGGGSKKVVRISSFPNPIDDFPMDLEIVGDLKNLLARLTSSEYPATEHVEIKINGFLRRREDFLGLRSPDNNLILPQTVISVLNKYMDDDTILVSDVGLHRVYTTLFGKVYAPNSFFASCGCATFGFALPAAMGAQIANPDKTVFAVVGDGGFHSGSQDLETLSRYNLPVIILLMKDNNMGLIRIYENLNNGEANLDTVSFSGVDFKRLAEASNCRGVSVKEQEELKHQIQKALKLREPTLIEIPVLYDYRFRGDHHKRSLGDFVDAV